MPAFCHAAGRRVPAPTVPLGKKSLPSPSQVLTKSLPTPTTVGDDMAVEGWESAFSDIFAQSAQ